MDAATATILAALIAAIVSIINMTLSKEQKISEFRQAWLDELRKDLALFFTCVRAFTRAAQEQSIDEAVAQLYKNGALLKQASDTTPIPINPFKMTDEQISKMRFEVAESRYRIRLRLNTKEEDNRKLLESMQTSITEMQKVIDYRPNCKKIIEFEIFKTGLQELVENTLNSAENASEISADILKKEWNHVKEGEPAFQLIRNVIAPIVLIMGIIVLGLKISGFVLF